MNNLELSTIGNLIPVFTAEIGGVSTLAVDARELHQFLGAKRGFSSWIKKRLAENKFVEGEDFTFTKTGEPASSGFRTRLDYILELNTAKELAMQEKNEKGRMVRKYFIECERKIHEAQHITDQPATETPHFFETKQGRLLNKAVHDRLLFWTMEKRDGIFHPGIDRHMLFSITTDIYAALLHELFNESFFDDSNTSTSISKSIKFINEWVPSFFRGRANVA